MTKPQVPIVLRVITPTMEEVWKYSGEAIRENPHYYSVDMFSSLFQKYYQGFEGEFEVYFLPNRNRINSDELPKADKISKRRLGAIRQNSHLIFADLVVPTVFGKINYLSKRRCILANLCTEPKREFSVPAILSLTGNGLFKRNLEIIGAEIEQTSSSEGASTRTGVRKSKAPGCLADYLEYFPNQPKQQA